jgi:hypothetical protein
MANTRFDAKSFNPEAFGKYVDSIPNVQKAELAKSGAIGKNENAHNALATQTGSLYARIPYTGRISASTSQNYDGVNDITSSNLDTFEQGFITAGRMDAWTERDFSYDITSGKDFMDVVGEQVAVYKQQVAQGMLLNVLNGIFSMKDNWADDPVANAAAQEFKTKHTYDITAKAGMDAYVGAGTLNTAIQKACGDNKDIFKLVILHSATATNLENLRLLNYLTYTDADGITRNLAIGTWNGRLALVDDSMPTGFLGTAAGVYTITIASPASGDKITVNGIETTLDATSGASATAAASAVKDSLDADETFSATYSVSKSSGVLTITEKSGHYGAGAPTASVVGSATATVATTTEPTGDITYTSYVLGQNSINLDPIGAKVPYEMSRNAASHGGEDTLYVRDRYIVGANGVSFEKPASIVGSASNADLADGGNWKIVSNGTIAIPHKSIALARIISKG